MAESSKNKRLQWKRLQVLDPAIMTLEVSNSTLCTCITEGTMLKIRSRKLPLLREEEKLHGVEGDSAKEVSATSDRVDYYWRNSPRCDVSNQITMPVDGTSSSTT
jgi:hypothetical protein